MKKSQMKKEYQRRYHLVLRLQMAIEDASRKAVYYKNKEMSSLSKAYKKVKKELNKQLKQVNNVNKS